MFTSPRILVGLEMVGLSESRLLINQNYSNESVVMSTSSKETFLLKIFTGKKHRQIKLQRLQKEPMLFILALKWNL